MTRAQLAQMFRAELRGWQRAVPGFRAGLGIFRGCAPGLKRCGYRDVAYADLHTRIVWVAARALTWGRARVLGLLRHELGHLADTRPEDPGAEVRADRIALAVTGQPIHYDRRGVQTVRTGAGTSPVRPLHLHR